MYKKVRQSNRQKNFRGNPPIPSTVNLRGLHIKKLFFLLCRQFYI